MCSICFKTPCDTRCPNYITKKAKHYCTICNEGILDGEEYIENDCGEYRHYDCFSGMKDLLEWLGYSVKTMDDWD